VTGETSGEPGRERRPHLALAIVTGLVAFLIVTAWSQQRAASRSTQSRRAQLVALVSARQRRIADLEGQLAALRRQLAAAANGSGAVQVVQLQRELDGVSLIAGTSPASGPGIEVRLGDSPLAKPDDPSAADFQIQDTDVQLVVNALWEAGAEAVSINGQRIVGTTAIRSAGGAILVNYRVLTSPYRIDAIGDSSQLERSFDSSAIASRFRSWVDIYHLGFDVKRARHLSLPAYAGGIRYRYAHPASG